MNRTPVVSSHIKSIGWENETLEIQFSDESVFSYAKVPEILWKEFERSESKGKFLNSRIRGQFAATKVVPE